MPSFISAICDQRKGAELQPPKTVKADPSTSSPICATIRRVKSSGDYIYVVYEGSELPKSIADGQEKLWLWIHTAARSREDKYSIELENFKRARGELKGEVLFSAAIDKFPMLDYFHRLSGSNSHRFVGFYGGPGITE